MLSRTNISVNVDDLVPISTVNELTHSAVKEL